LGGHLKKRRRALGILQREAAERMGIQRDTYVNWEKDKTRPGASQFRPVVTFFGHDPTPAREILSERLNAKRRQLGVAWRMPPSRAAPLEASSSPSRGRLPPCFNCPSDDNG